MEEKLQNRQAYISFSLHPTPSPPPAQTCCVRMPLSVEERVAITLWRLGTNIEYRSIAHLFGVGLSTVCVTVHEVCTAIVNVLGNDTSGFQLEKMFRPQLMAFYIHGGFHNISAQSMVPIYR